MYYETSDIHLAAYLELRNVVLKSLIRNGNRVIFRFESTDTIKAVIADYYNDEDNILNYTNILRNLKGRIINSS